MSFAWQATKGSIIADGKVHNWTSVVLSVPTGIATGIAASDPVVGLGALLGCLLGMILTPDLDQVAISFSEWGMVKKLGPLGFFWMGLWYFYARAIPHRSPLSHLPILGTAIRVVYTASLLVAAWAILGRPILPPMPVWGWAFLLGGFEGLVVSDTGHFLLDLLPKRKKRKRNEVRRVRSRNYTRNPRRR